ncbi:unnamed protein product [Tenebrio molitor]|jgi:hypothetical protein|nr:unnamed protein product [Tenebrio molitor]
MSYSTLKSELIKKKNVHITEKNPTGVVCVILNVKEPNSPYYKMVPTELQIKACESANRCKELTQCEKGVVDKSETNLDESEIIISWEHFESLYIIMQYENKFINCRDTSEFHIRKLAKDGLLEQPSGTVVDDSFRSTTQENNHLIFYLQGNQSVSLHTFCPNLYYNTTCDDGLQEVVNVSSPRESKLVKGWTEFPLSNCDRQEIRKCNTTFKSIYQSANGQVNDNWNFDQYAGLVHFRNGGRSTWSERQYATVEAFNSQQTPTSLMTNTTSGTSGTLSGHYANNNYFNQTDDDDNRRQWLPILPILPILILMVEILFVIAIAIVAGYRLLKWNNQRNQLDHSSARHVGAQETTPFSLETNQPVADWASFL